MGPHHFFFHVASLSVEADWRILWRVLWFPYRHRSKRWKRKKKHEQQQSSRAAAEQQHSSIAAAAAEEEQQQPGSNSRAAAAAVACCCSCCTSVCVCGSWVALGLDQSRGIRRKVAASSRSLFTNEDSEPFQVSLVEEWSCKFFVIQSWTRCLI